MNPWADSIDSLAIPNRVYNALRRAGITSIAMIQSMEDDDLLCIRNFGRAGLHDLRHAVPRTPEEPPFPLTLYAP